VPNYTLKNKNTEEEKDVTMTIAEMEQYISDNPDWFVMIKPLGVRDNFVASRFTNIPIDSDFKNILDNMKKANPGSTIDY